MYCPKCVHNRTWARINMQVASWMQNNLSYFAFNSVLYRISHFIGKYDGFIGCACTCIAYNGNRNAQFLLFFLFKSLITYIYRGTVYIDCLYILYYTCVCKVRNGRYLLHHANFYWNQDLSAWDVMKLAWNEIRLKMSEQVNQLPDLKNVYSLHVTVYVVIRKLN